MATVLLYEYLEVYEVIKKSLKPPNSYFKAQWKEIRAAYNGNSKGDK